MSVIYRRTINYNAKDGKGERQVVEEFNSYIKATSALNFLKFSKIDKIEIEMIRK